MVSKTMVVKAAEGLHMRPAGVIAREAGKFDSDVTIVFGDKMLLKSFDETLLSDTYF